MLYLKILFFVLFSFNVSAADDRLIRILAWVDYLSPEIVKAFETENDSRIQLTTYYDENMRDYLFDNKSDQQFDILITSAKGIIDYSRKNMLLPINESNYSNFDNMDRSFVPSKQINKYSVGLSYDALGIVYRKDKVVSIPRTWLEFVNPPKEHFKKIELIDDADDVLDIHLMSANKELSNYSIEDINDAGKHALRFNEHVAKYEYPSHYDGDTIMEGISYIGTAYSSNAYKMKEKLKEIDFIYPEEGTKIWVDFAAITMDSGQKDLSEKFLNYLMSSEVSSLNMKFNKYISMNKITMSNTKDVFFENGIFNPRKRVKLFLGINPNRYLLNKKTYLYKRIVGVK
jgi:spermidine/putrescine transport system substrate-binding protein